MQKNPLRITFILPTLSLAGGIRVIAIYAHRLIRRGHQVHLISVPSAPSSALERGFMMIRSALGSTPAAQIGDASHLTKLGLSYQQVQRGHALRDSDVPDGDVVIATWWATAALVQRLSARKGAKAYFVQDYGANPGQPLDKVAKTWELPLHKIVISRWLNSLVEQHCGLPGDYVPNAVDHQQFHAPPRGKQARPTVGFQFNPQPQKGCDVAIEAIRKARERCADLRVLAYGPRVSDDHGLILPESCEFWQGASDDKLREIYASCDAWLFSSRLEGFGLPILEAMACRTPVIGTSAGAAPDLLSEGGGVLLPADDPGAMADAILQFVRMPEHQWREMSDKAFATAARYTWDDATDQFEASLRRAMAAAAGERQSHVSSASSSPADTKGTADQRRRASAPAAG